MKVLAPAKINLYLEITGVRPDGYHEIQTLFQTVRLCDELDVRIGRENGSGPIFFDVRDSMGTGLCPADSSNIVWKAAERLRRDLGLEGSWKITLRKNVPIQAGLGGGSSDAAAVLKAAQLIFPKKLAGKAKYLNKIAKDLGADVPFFLEGGCAYAKGIGDKIQSLGRPPKFWAVIVKPEIGLSTPQVYKWYDEYHRVRQLVRSPHSGGGGSRRQSGGGTTGGSPQPFGGLEPVAEQTLTGRPKINKIRRLLGEGRPVQDWAPYLYNGFEEVVFTRFPELGALKRELIRRGALNALLSGSGSALYGLVSSKEEALRIRRNLKGSNVKVWVADSI